MKRTAGRASPLADRQVLDNRVLEPANVAGLARRIGCRDPDQDSTSLCQLVFEHREEATPGCVRYCPGEAPVFDHALDSQVLHDHDLVFSRKPRGDLVLVVFAGVGDFLMYAGNADALLLPTGRACLFAGKTTLLASQLPLVFAEIPRVRLDVAFVVCEEFFQAHVDAHDTALIRKQICLIGHAQRHEVPIPRRPRDSRTGNPAHYRSGKFGFHNPELREPDSVAFSADVAVHALRSVFLGVVVLRLEPRIPRLFLEEPVERILQVAEGILERRAVRFVQPDIFWESLELGQHGIGVLVPHALAA